MIRQIAIIAIVMGSSSFAEAEAVNYAQLSDFPAGTVYASEFDNSPSGVMAAVYDNFMLPRDSAISHVNWQGGYFGTSTTGTVAGFTLKIWDDVNGVPGSVVFADEVSGLAGELLVGTQPLTTIFDYSANLSSSFFASGNTEYWLSIVADTARPGQWGWHSGTGGDTASIQDYNGVPGPIPRDMAFSLAGIEVPEPASAALGIYGLLVLLRPMRRRNRFEPAIVPAECASLPILPGRVRESLDERNRRAPSACRGYPMIVGVS